MVNTKDLQIKMQKNGYTLESLSQAIGISRTGLFNKIHNIKEFRVSEIKKISELLKLKKSEMTHIFFATDVELHSTSKP